MKYRLILEGGKKKIKLSSVAVIFGALRAKMEGSLLETRGKSVNHEHHMTELMAHWVLQDTEIRNDLYK